jgi:hypothetical protein
MDNCHFQGIAAFRQYILQKNEILRKNIKFLQLFFFRYTCDVRAYAAEQCKNATADLTPTTHGTIIRLGRSVEDSCLGH